MTTIKHGAGLGNELTVWRTSGALAELFETLHVGD
jgi:hypothetical protein